jgi:hypothetical protein
MDRHRPELQRFINHTKPIASDQQRFTRYTGSFLIAPQPPTHPCTGLDRPPRLYIHNGERVSRRDEDRHDMEANYSSWAPFIGLLVVVVFCAAAWILAPKGENQTYVHPSFLCRAFTTSNHTRYRPRTYLEHRSACALPAWVIL